MTSGITIKLTALAAAVGAALVFTFSAVAATRPDDRAGLRGADPRPTSTLYHVKRTAAVAVGFAERLRASAYSFRSTGRYA